MKYGELNQEKTRNHATFQLLFFYQPVIFLALNLQTKFKICYRNDPIQNQKRIEEYNSMIDLLRLYPISSPCIYLSSHCFFQYD